MSYMSALDAFLTDHKLSFAQKNAVTELLSGGFTTAKPNTIKSLESKGLVINHGDFYLFEEEFKTQLKALYAEPETETQEISVVDELGDLLNSDPWAEKYQDDWAAWEKELGGFGELSKWQNTKVWDGLTAVEIAEDIATARPVNRQARRMSAKIVRKLVKVL